jgi:hypothetical protein
VRKQPYGSAFCRDDTCIRRVAKRRSPPARDVDFKGAPDWFADNSHIKPYGLADAPLTYDPPVSDAAPLAFVRDPQQGPIIADFRSDATGEGKRHSHFRRIQSASGGSGQPPIAPALDRSYCVSSAIRSA